MSRTKGRQSKLEGQTQHPKTVCVAFGEWNNVGAEWAILISVCTYIAAQTPEVIGGIEVGIDVNGTAVKDPAETLTTANGWTTFTFTSPTKLNRFNILAYAWWNGERQKAARYSFTYPLAATPTDTEVLAPPKLKTSTGASASAQAMTLRYTPFGATDGERSVELECVKNTSRAEATFKIFSDTAVKVASLDGATHYGTDTLITLPRSATGCEKVRIEIADPAVQEAKIHFGIDETGFVNSTPLIIERVAPAPPPPPAKKPTFVKVITREVGADFVVITFVTCESSDDGAALLAGNVRVDSTARVTVTDDDTTAVIASTCYSTLVPTNAGTCERNVRFTLPTGIDAAEISHQPEGFNQTSEPIKLERKAPAAPAAPADIKFALGAPNADGIYSLDVEFAPSADMTFTRHNIEWSDTGNPTGTWNAATLPLKTDATGKKRVFVRTVKNPGDAILQLQSGKTVSTNDAFIKR